MKLVIIGAGGHSKVVAEAARLQGGWEVVGFLDSGERPPGSTHAGAAILGDESMLAGLVQEGVTHFAIGFGMLEPGSARADAFARCLAAGLRPATIIHPAATVSDSAQIGDGTQVMAGVIVNAEAFVGQNVILNTGAIIEHDANIGEHCHIAPRATVLGGVQVGPMSLVGAGSTLRQGIFLGERSLVAAGAVVVSDVASGQAVAGIPARPRE